MHRGALAASACASPSYADPAKMRSTRWRQTHPRDGGSAQVAVDTTRQERSIFIVRLHDDAETFKRAKVVGQCQRNTGTALAIRRICDRILVHFFNVSDASVFDSPQFLRILFRVGHKCWRWIDQPTIFTIS